MPKVGGTLVRNSGQGKGTVVQQKAQGTGALPASQVGYARGPKRQEKNTQNMPNLSVGSREHAFLNMYQDPKRAQSALPPVVLPARAVADKIYQEVLLSTDASGNAAVLIRPHLNAMVAVSSTWTGTQVATWTYANASQYTSFSTNFQGYIPLVLDVEARYTGSVQSTSGRFYGQAGVPGNSLTPEVTNFPQEDFGCESLASDGASCVWYSTSPVWNNPSASTINSPTTEWGDVAVCVALIGGPPSVTNLVSVGVYFHFAAFPKAGIVGLVPSAITADTNAALVAGLMAAATSGVTAGALSAKERDQHRKKKLKLQDVIKVGGKVLGTMSPYLGPAAEAASVLSMLMA